jgi:glycosyltransferase involved in cell wall biosynthesis
MKKVLLRAPLLTNSGYGIHSRQIFSWLYEKEDVDLTVECVQWGRTSWILDDKQENGIFKKIMDCSKPIEKGIYDISFQVQLPDEWDNTLAKKNVGVTAVVETDKCNPSWINCCNSMDEIIVPSTFTKNVLKRSGMLTKKVSVVPEWFNEYLTNRSLLAKTQLDERYKKFKKEFNVLVIGTLTSNVPEDDRKNLSNTIKWLCEEFKDNEDVGIVLKTNFGKGTSSDKELCESYLKSALKEYRKNNYPEFNFLHGNMKKEEVAALIDHKSIKVYASATRGEGYGLPLIEAAAAGKPIVATNWSGHLEFLQKENFNTVDYELVEVNKTKVDGRIFLSGFKWADPKEDSFKKEMRNVYENYSSASEKAKKMKKHILFNFNSTVIKNKYDEIFQRVVKKC